MYITACPSMERCKAAELAAPSLCRPSAACSMPPASALKPAVACCGSTRSSSSRWYRPGPRKPWCVDPSRKTCTAECATGRAWKKRVARHHNRGWGWVRVGGMPPRQDAHYNPCTPKPPCLGPEIDGLPSACKPTSHYCSRRRHSPARSHTRDERHACLGCLDCSGAPAALVTAPSECGPHMAAHSSDAKRGDLLPTLNVQASAANPYRASIHVSVAGQAAFDFAAPALALDGTPAPGALGARPALAAALEAHGPGALRHGGQRCGGRRCIHRCVSRVLFRSD